MAGNVTPDPYVGNDTAALIQRANAARASQAGTIGGNATSASGDAATQASFVQRTNALRAAQAAAPATDSFGNAVSGTGATVEPGAAPVPPPGMARVASPSPMPASVSAVGPDAATVGDTGGAAGVADAGAAAGAANAGAAAPLGRAASAVNGVLSTAGNAVRKGAGMTRYTLGAGARLLGAGYGGYELGSGLREGYDAGNSRNYNDSPAQQDAFQGVLDTTAAIAPTPITIGAAVAGHAVNAAVNSEPGQRFSASIGDTLSGYPAAVAQAKDAGRASLAAAMHRFPIGSRTPAQDTAIQNMQRIQNSLDGTSESSYDPPSEQPNAAPVAAATAAAGHVQPTLPATTALQVAAQPPTDADLGMTRLPQGVHRFADPHVGVQMYSARGKDGSTIFTDDPTDPSVAIDPRGFTRANVNVPNYPNTPGSGAVGGFDEGGNRIQPVTAGAYGTNAIQSNVLLNQLNGGGAPNADKTFARNSAGANVNNIINTTTDPYTGAAEASGLAAAGAADPNGTNPEVAASNNSAQLKLAAALDDQRKKFFGPNGSQGAADAALLGSTGVQGMGAAPNLGMLGVQPGSASTKGGPVAFMKTMSDIRYQAQRGASAVSRAGTSAQAETDTAAHAKAQLALDANKQLENERQNFVTQNSTPQKRAYLQTMGMDPDSYSNYEMMQRYRDADPAMRNMLADRVRADFQSRATLAMQRHYGMAQGIANRVIGSPGYPTQPAPGSALSMRYSTGLGGPELTDSSGNTLALGGMRRAESVLPFSNTYSDPQISAAFNDPVVSSVLPQLLARDAPTPPPHR